MNVNIYLIALVHIGGPFCVKGDESGKDLFVISPLFSGESSDIVDRSHLFQLRDDGCEASLCFCRILATATV